MARLYGRRWNKAAKNYLDQHPWCVYCEAVGKPTQATVVDHKIQHHNTDVVLFWDEDNWQALCKTCHDSVKQAQEKNGYLRGADVSGQPLDAQHVWNAMGGRSHAGAVGQETGASESFS